jgi:AcrR family transcriptional regulator
MPPRALSKHEVEEFREQLCRAAERLFAAHGYEGVTLRALATALGCSPMTPYRYFENKQAIFDAVREAAFVRFGARVEAAAAAHAEPIARFRALGEAYLGFARSEPHAYRIMFELEKPSQGEAEPIHGWAPLLTTLEECVERGLLRGDPLELAHIAWVGMHGLATLEMSGKLILGRSQQELVAPVIDAFLRGAGAPPDALERETP